MRSKIVAEIIEEFDLFSDERVFDISREEVLEKIQSISVDELETIIQLSIKFDKLMELNHEIVLHVYDVYTNPKYVLGVLDSIRNDYTEMIKVMMEDYIQYVIEEKK
jgi:hypothetical protein